MRYLIILLLFTLPGCSMFSGVPGPASTAAKPEEVFPTPWQEALWSLSLSDSGGIIAVGSSDGTSLLLDRHGKVLTSWPSTRGSGIIQCAVSDKVGLIVSGSNSGVVSVRQTCDYRVVAEQELSNRANAIAFHPNKPLALIGTDVHRGTEGLVRRYNIGSKRWEEVLDTKNVAGVKIEEPGVYGLEFNPDGIRLAVLTRSTVLLIDWESQQVIHSIAQRGQLLYQSMHFSHDGKSLVLSDNNRTFWVYDTTTWACRETVIPDDKQMKQFCITRDDKYLCAAISTPYHSDYQGLWALYSFPEIKLLAYVPANMRGVGQIVADPKEDRVVTGGGDGTIMTWSIENVLKSNQ